jgi:hypothetical protein
MGTIHVINRTYSAMRVCIAGPDGGIASLILPTGPIGTFTNCPPWDFAIMGFSMSNNSLQHLGKVRPSMEVYEVFPNQGREVEAEEVQAAAGPTAQYELRQE